MRAGQTGAGYPPGRHRAIGRLTIVLAAGLLTGGMAFAVGVYALWPPSPAPEAATVPHLPIVIANETFTVAPDAIRMAVQRRPGPQERIDLVYAWPALTPPRAPAAADAVDLAAEQRIYVTIAPSGGLLPPAERLRSIYLRYVRSEPPPARDGLVVAAFRDGTPYQGEDLAYDEQAPERFIARCERPGTGRPPATCLSERMVGGATLTLRFPREWLQDWRALVDGFDRLQAQLRPKANG